ncbi:MAG: DUF1273 family protein [Clostridia bacterium]|nr:DUF1273 family protein [Clostridia bacterium]
MAKKSFGEIKTAFFTGHRNIDAQTQTQISFVLDYLLKTMYNSGITKFYAGGALGFDTLAALAVLRLKKNFPDVTLELVLPCKNQTKFWTGEDVETYNYILSQADRVEYMAESYTSTCMHERNDRLVELGDIGVAFLEHSGGGTAYTVNHALNQEKEIINVYDMLISLHK